MALRNEQKRVLRQARGGLRVRWAARSFSHLALVALAAAGLFLLLEWTVRPASAQFFGFGFEQPRQRRQAAPPRQNFFPFPFFGSPRAYQPYGRPHDDPARPRPRSRAHVPKVASDARPPAQKRPDTDPPKHVIVFGDSMADWLSYGLEEAFAETNEFGVIRKIRPGAGLIRNDAREHDWVQAITEATEKADFVVIMTGLGDRRVIGSRADERAKARDRRARPASKPNETDPEAPNADNEKAGSGLHEFRSEKWAELYAKRIDEVIAALKAKNVPVIWVGLPPIRGARARSEVPYLNDIYRLSAEKAGIAYVDTWEGFVGEDGDFNATGPDVIGQVRRLRSADGVHFTRPGARKLAHFVDREMKRLLSRGQPVALAIPTDPKTAEPPKSDTPAGPAARPLAGPVVALTGGNAPAEDALVGAGRTLEKAAGDPLAVSVLVRGEPLPGLPGRADYFGWPSPYPVADNDVVEPSAPAAATVAARPQAAPEAQPPANANTGSRPVNANTASSAGPTRAVR